MVRKRTQRAVPKRRQKPLPEPLHKRLWLHANDCITVRSAQPIVVYVMDYAGFRAFCKGEPAQFYGGGPPAAEVTISVPKHDHWYVVLDDHRTSVSFEVVRNFTVTQRGELRGG